MSYLDNVTFDEIYNKIMIILLANEGVLFNQYRLYSLVLDKFIKINEQETNFVPNEFKHKYLITLRQLAIKDTNITVTKKNNIYQVIYGNLPDDNIEIKTVTCLPQWINESEFNKFIINNNIDLNYQDPESGNTIYHNMLNGNDSDNVKQLLKTHKINYNVKNHNDKTPIECITNLGVAVTIINDLSQQLNDISQRLNSNETELLEYKKRFNIILREQKKYFDQYLKEQNEIYEKILDQRSKYYDETLNTQSEHYKEALSEHINNCDKILSKYYENYVCDDCIQERKKYYESNINYNIILIVIMLFYLIINI